MKKYGIFFSFLTAVLFNISTALASDSVKIIAVVNDDIISSQDLQNRINSFVLNSHIPLNAQTANMIKARVLQNTIDEKLKLQAAQKEGIKISEGEINEAINNFEKNNRIPQGKLREILQSSGISYNSYRDQLRADLGWIRIVRRHALSEEITQPEIEKAYQNATNDLSTPKYMVSEIFIRKEHAKNIQNLVDNLKNDQRFELYAVQFSESASASNGGKLGWINKGRLGKPLEKALEKMKIGEISQPILLGDGYYILRLEQIFDPQKDQPQIPDKEDIKRFLENQNMEEFAKKHLQDLRQQAIIELRN